MGYQKGPVECVFKTGPIEWVIKKGSVEVAIKTGPVEWAIIKASVECVIKNQQGFACHRMHTKFTGTGETIVVNVFIFRAIQVLWPVKLVPPRNLGSLKNH